MLLAMEENMVWERAAASTVAVGRSEHAGMGERLVSNERFTAQISACRIIPTAFPRMTLVSRTQHMHMALGPLLHTVAEADRPSALDNTGVIDRMLLGLYRGPVGGGWEV